MPVDKDKLNNLKEALKPMIKQPLEGLLYDLDLLPEQLQYEIDGKRYSAIVNLYHETLQKENEQLKAERLEMAKAIRFYTREDSLIMSHRLLFKKAEQIIRESK